MQRVRGASICSRQRLRSLCKECGGRASTRTSSKGACARIEGGASICPHQRRRRLCKECGGPSICPHQCSRCDIAGVRRRRRRRRFRHAHHHCNSSWRATIAAVHRCCRGPLLVLEGVPEQQRTESPVHAPLAVSVVLHARQPAEQARGTSVPGR